MEPDMSIHILENIRKNTFYKKAPYIKGYLNGNQKDFSL